MILSYSQDITCTLLFPINDDCTLVMSLAAVKCILHTMCYKKVSKWKKNTSTKIKLYNNAAALRKPSMEEDRVTQTALKTIISQNISQMGGREKHIMGSKTSGVSATMWSTPQNRPLLTSNDRLSCQRDGSKDSGNDLIASNITLDLSKPPNTDITDIRSETES